MQNSAIVLVPISCVIMDFVRLLYEKVWKYNLVYGAKTLGGKPRAPSLPRGNKMKITLPNRNSDQYPKLRLSVTKAIISFYSLSTMLRFIEIS